MAEKRLYAPGPRGGPLLGVLLAFRSDPLAFLTKAVASFGPVISFRLGLRRVTFLTLPTHIQHVLQKSHHRYTNSPRVQTFSLLLGNGLLVSEGEYWRRHRQAIQRAFRSDR